MANNINPDDLLTVAQAAQERGTTRQAINYLVRQGKLETVEIAGRRFVSRKALAEYVPDPGGRPPKQATAAPPTTKGEIRSADKTAQKLNQAFRKAAEDEKQAGKKRGGKK